MNTYNFNRINIVFVAFAILLLPSAVWATGNYDGGDGSEGDPFQINTPAQMNEIGQHPEDWGSYFILTADINLAEFTGTEFNIIGIDFGNPFTGFFDGNDHIISNFTYISPGAENIGLFGFVGTGCEITNLGITTVNVNAGNNHVGGLVGWNRYGTISNCYAMGTVTGGDYVGNLVGYNSGTISNCYATGTVTRGAQYVGGLAGNNRYGTVSNCYAMGTVTGGAKVGGLVGHNFNGIVSNCYAMGKVTGDNYVGGLVGENDYHTTVSNCFATGTVTGGDYVGGLVGWNYISDIYASFWDTQTTGRPNGVGYNEGSGTVDVYGRTTAEMQTQSTFTDYGWDFVGETDNGTEDIWVLQGANYPWLAWQSQNIALVPSQYPSIQAAIDASYDGDTVIVAEGIYKGGGNRDIDFKGLAITVRSIDPEDTDAVKNTIIDCQGSEADPHRGFYFHSGEDGNSVLDGFTIINGFVPSPLHGGGIYCVDNSNPTIMNCTLRENSAGWRGGGMANEGSSPTVANCKFSENSAMGRGGAWSISAAAQW